MHESILNAIIHGIEFFAATIIVVAVLIAAGQLVIEVFRERKLTGATAIRLGIGQQLVLALEFLIAADILKTVLAPTLDDLFFLGGIILIRTVLSVSIAYELRNSSGSASHPVTSDAGQPSPGQEVEK